MTDSAWILLFEGRIYSTSGGAEREYSTPIMDWGMEIAKLETAVVVTGRSSSAAKLGLRITEAPEGDPDLLLPHGTTPIATAAVTAALPTYVKGGAVGDLLPFWTAVPVCESTGATEEWLDIRVYAGGRKY